MRRKIAVEVGQVASALFFLASASRIAVTSFVLPGGMARR
jgi:hypothetical protein